MARSLLGFDVKEAGVERGRRGMFLWTVVLLLLTGMALASWIGSFYVVAHPEKPSCYRLLQKLKKLEPPKQFMVTEGPFGKFLSPKMMLEKYGKMGPRELEKANAELVRMYIKNYRETKQPVDYVAGVFEVVEAHVLSAKDFFPSGVVAVTQARDYPQVLMEMVFPAATGGVAMIKSFLPVGRELTLERTRDLGAILHVERLSDSRMQFTVVPLSYGSFQLKEGRGSFTLKSPEDLIDPAKGGDAKNGINIDGALPIVNGMRLQKGLATHAEYHRKVLASTEMERPKANQIIAFRSPNFTSAPVEVATPVVIREASPPVPSAPPQPPTPSPKPPQNMRPTTTVVPVVASPPKPTLISNTTPGVLPERFPLPPRPVVRATPQTPKPEPDPPKPIVLSLPPAAPPPAEEVRVLSTKDASALVDNFESTSESFLSGEFVVTGVLGQRVALRAREALRDPDADPTIAGSNGAMIIVDFPKGVLPPAKDATFTRDGKKGFRIKSIRRLGTGQITILAEESQKP